MITASVPCPKKYDTTAAPVSKISSGERSWLRRTLPQRAPWLRTAFGPTTVRLCLASASLSPDVSVLSRESRASALMVLATPARTPSAASP